MTKTTAALAALTFSLLTTAASAETIVALSGGDTLTSIDSTRRAITGSVKVAGGAKLVGIDVRPSDKMLYGVTTDGAIVTIDPKTGQWTKKSQLSEKLPDNATITVDFNPAADRLRILSSTGTSLRVNVEDGKAVVDGSLKFADTDPAKGKTPKVIAGGYSNSCAGTKETALYDVDMTTGALMRQAPPNDGILVTIGALGVKNLKGAIAFDVWSDCQGKSFGWMLNQAWLYGVDLTTGKAAPLGAVKDLSANVTDMAILPAS